MLCFDVKVDKEAKAYAEEIGVKIFEADIIYHLFDKFTAHMKQLEEQRKEESKMLAVFPCVLRPVAVFNKTSPIVIGVDVVEGNLKITTPICAVKKNPATGVKEIVQLGRVYVSSPLFPYVIDSEYSLLTYPQHIHRARPQANPSLQARLAVCRRQN